MKRSSGKSKQASNTPVYETNLIISIERISNQEFSSTKYFMISYSKKNFSKNEKCYWMAWWLRVFVFQIQ